MVAAEVSRLPGWRNPGLTRGGRSLAFAGFGGAAERVVAFAGSVTQRGVALW